MGTGEIADGPDGPTITCKFHNSKFKLATGEATQWTTGVMGMENAMIGNIMGKVQN
jgi:nitrite reductase/ring-hydroxylating ferredoxin subunit